jgi:putative FmdB family regulatory protein
MPIYEYDCEDCGARFDKLVFLTGQPKPIVCPECSSGQVSKRLSLIAASGGGSAEGASASAACTTSA